MRFWDSSAVVPLLVEQDATVTMERRLAQDGGMAAWWATPIECSSALARLERAGVLAFDEMEVAASRLDAMAEAWDEVQPSEPVRRAALRLLRVHPLRAADAMQAAAAIVMAEHDPSSLEVVCLDGRLTETLRREGFRVRGEDL
ncbi:MAG: type II toxin-antitoxin system VapC family toxin [Acidimicrobiales bacterium]